MFISVLTNLNWESWTKNLVNFNFIMGVHWNIWFFRGQGGSFQNYGGREPGKKEGVKIYTEADFKVSWDCPILLDFFTYFQIFCDGNTL